MKVIPSQVRSWQDLRYFFFHKGISKDIAGVSPENGNRADKVSGTL